MGPPQEDDHEAERLLADALGAVVLESWRQTADGTWVTDTGLLSTTRP